MRAKKIEEWAQKNGLTIAIGAATDWTGTVDGAIRWCDGSRAKARRLYAYAYIDPASDCWIEPTRFFERLSDLKQDVERQITHGRG